MCDGNDQPPPLEWGVFSIFRRADDVTRTISKGGVLVNQGRLAEGDGVTRTISKGGVLVNQGRLAEGDDVTRTVSKGGGVCL